MGKDIKKGAETKGDNTPTPIIINFNDAVAAETAYKGKVDEAKALSDEIETYKAVIVDLKKDLETKSSDTVGGTPVVKHEGVSYMVTAAKFHFEGEVISSENLKTDKVLLGKLIEMGVGFLVKC